MTRKPSRRLVREIPPEHASHFAPIVNRAATTGTVAMGTRGVGKTTLLFLIAWINYVYQRKPVLIVSPVASLFERLFTKICTFREEDQRELWRGIRYVNTAGVRVGDDVYVMPTPYYHRTGHGPEGPFNLAQRFPDAMQRLDPPLSAAGVMGFNPLWRLATAAGEVLCSLPDPTYPEAGCYQVTEIGAILRDPGAWADKFAEAVARCPEVAPAVDYLRNEYGRLPHSEKSRLRDTLLTKLTLFADPVMAAQFGAALPAVTVPQAREEGLLVCYDLSDELDQQPLQLKMLTIVTDILNGIKRTGRGDTPLVLIADEFSAQLAPGRTPSSLLVNDWDEMINRLSRNLNVEVVAAIQEPYQVPSPMRETLLSLANVFCGRLTDPVSQRIMAERFFPYEAHREHYREPILHTDRFGTTEVGERVHYHTPQEQAELNRVDFAAIPKLTFKRSLVYDEGGQPGPLLDYAIGHLDRRLVPDRRLAAECKRRLARRDGRKVADVLAEIDARLPSRQPVVVGRGGVERGGATQDGTVEPDPASSPRRPTVPRRERVGM